MFPPIFVADTKIIYGYNFVAPLRKRKHPWWDAFLVLLLIAECSFIKKKFLLQTFSNKSSKIDYQWNIIITYFAKLYRILSAKLYTVPLKFHPLCRLVQVHGYNLALLAAFSLFLRRVLVFCLSLFLNCRHFVKLHKIFFHQIEK